MDFKTGEDLKKWRKENHMTHKELAEKIGYTTDHLCHIENEAQGSKPLSKRLIKALTDLDADLNPVAEIEPLVEQLNKLREFSIFSKEIKDIENCFVSLMELPKNTYDGSAAYLAWIIVTLKKLMEIKELPLSKNEILYSELNKEFGSLLREAKIYLTKRNITIIDDRKSK